MPDKTYKIIEVVGVSDDSIHQAVSNAVNKDCVVHVSSHPNGDERP